MIERVIPVHKCQAAITEAIMTTRGNLARGNGARRNAAPPCPALKLTFWLEGANQARRRRERATHSTAKNPCPLESRTCDSSPFTHAGADALAPLPLFAQFSLLYFSSSSVLQSFDFSLYPPTILDRPATAPVTTKHPLLSTLRPTLLHHHGFRRRRCAGRSAPGPRYR